MKVIKRRIKSVESTMQITKAMELVASSKLKKAREKADRARPYFKALYETMREIQIENSAFFSLYTNKSREVKTALLIVAAGDRGLAGGFNSNILKLADARLKELKSKGRKVKIIAIGKKSAEYFAKRGDDIVDSYINVAEGFKINQAARLSDIIVKFYIRGDIDSVELFHNAYVNPLVQEPKRILVLPLETVKAEAHEKTAVRELPVYEPSAETVFNLIVPKYIAGMIFGAVVDGFAAEQAARRNAMEAASDNAEEMISDLSLMYNRARQASITQEITEIIGGAASSGNQ